MCLDFNYLGSIPDPNKPVAIEALGKLVSKIVDAVHKVGNVNVHKACLGRAQPPDALEVGIELRPGRGLLSPGQASENGPNEGRASVRDLNPCRCPTAASEPGVLRVFPSRPVEEDARVGRRLPKVPRLADREVVRRGVGGRPGSGH